MRPTFLLTSKIHLKQISNTSCHFHAKLFIFQFSFQFTPYWRRSAEWKLRKNGPFRIVLQGWGRDSDPGCPRGRRQQAWAAIFLRQGRIARSPEVAHIRTTISRPQRSVRAVRHESRVAAHLAPRSPLAADDGAGPRRLHSYKLLLLTVFWRAGNQTNNLRLSHYNTLAILIIQTNTQLEDFGGTKLSQYIFLLLTQFQSYEDYKAVNYTFCNFREKSLAN